MTGMRNCPHCGTEVELQREYGQYRIVCPGCALSVEYQNEEDCDTLVNRWNERYKVTYILLSTDENGIHIHGKYDSMKEARLFDEKLREIGCQTVITEI